jgi:hypothetical protein
MRMAHADIPLTNIHAVTPNIFERQGYLMNKRLRVVCRACNSGWMSEVESSAKRILIPLICATPISLNAESQTLVALWAAMRSAVFERDDPKFAALTEAEYRHIKDRRSPPPNWHVFLASYEGVEWDTRIFHYGASLQKFGEPYPTQPNTQMTIIGFGKAVLVAISSTSKAAQKALLKLSPAEMTMIWPEQTSLEWPFSKAMSDDELRRIAYGFGSAGFL